MSLVFIHVYALAITIFGTMMTIVHMGLVNFYFFWRSIYNA